MPQLIIINGAPSSGKTTIARWLAANTGMPALGKEEIKEFLFDALGYSNRDWSRILGRASTEMLYSVAREFLAGGQSMIIENSFWPEYAGPALSALAEELHANVIELYCQTDEETRMTRFRERYESGERHPGHVDNLATMRDVTQHQPLGIGMVIHIDTTNVNDETFAKLQQQLSAAQEASL